MAGLLILEHMYNLSDEALCDRWVNPYIHMSPSQVRFWYKVKCHLVADKQVKIIIVSMDKLKNIEAHFAFGKNWAAYAALIHEPQIEEATKGVAKADPDG